jgi:hypothetical protein
LLIDRDGREVARKMGAAEWDNPQMISLIEHKRTTSRRCGRSSMSGVSGIGLLTASALE